jgi:hypothetical protein
LGDVPQLQCDIEVHALVDFDYHFRTSEALEAGFLNLELVPTGK